MESFFGTLKTECLHHYRFATREEARRVVFEYIEVIYAPKEVHLGDNRKRRHCGLGYEMPNEFHSAWLVQQKLAA